MFLVLQNFAFQKRGRCVGKKFTAAAYINSQCRVCSAALLNLVENLWFWALGRLLFLRALHVPGLEYRGENMTPRGSSLPEEQGLHHTIVKQLWTNPGGVEVGDKTFLSLLRTTYTQY